MLWRWKRYPGFGPWSHSPPWERPGWKRCWWCFGFPELSKDEELRMLEEIEKYLEMELEMVRRRIRELKGQKPS